MMRDMLFHVFPSKNPMLKCNRYDKENNALLAVNLIFLYKTKTNSLKFKLYDLLL